MKIKQSKTGKTKIQIVTSVRNLVEFLLNAGDIDERRGNRRKAEAMQEGSRIHRKLQRRAGADYHAEVPLKFIVSYDDYDLALEGRADGILYDEAEESEAENTLSGQVTIDEIKGMYTDVQALEEPVLVHLAQAKCYAYIFAAQNHLSEITVQLTYCNLDTEEIKRFTEMFSYEELEDWFLDLLKKYKKWADYLYAQKCKRQASIQGLEFPYAYREGQKQLATDVYRSIARNKILFVQAPTGTGKTLATIYPTVQALGQELGDKIFYLTAKNATGLVARDAFLLLEEKGYQGKTVVITAKDKMCPLEKRACNPEQCPFAKGHYDRVNDAVYELLQQKNMLDRETLIAWAKEKCVCPFELSLDVSDWVDHIVCDYNYVFDPNVYLKRFFAEGKNCDGIFLVDEAHNLVDRAREMYSETLIKEDFLRMKRKCKTFGKKIERALERCNRELLYMKRECESIRVLDDIDAFLFSLLNLAAAFDELLEKEVVIPEREEVLEFYFRMRNFIRLTDDVDGHYRIYCDYNEKEEFCLHLFCVDPSRMLQERLDKSRATVFFSATMLPLAYYRELLCEKKDVYAVYTESVFEKTQRALVIGKDVTSKYTRRNEQEYQSFVAYILRIVSAKKGNYMVFCPSYKMMEEIYLQFCALSLANYDVQIQQSGMKEQSREEFLAEFSKKRDKSLVAFCVLGGVFAEGIDLIREQLIGAIIVGVGLPQVNHSRELIKHYFEEIGKDGFAFAYLYPGMNKVIQAAGRVIRTTEDRGVIALLDERFCQSGYKNTFPREWDDVKICDKETIGDAMKRFWEQA